jgi:predicted Zn-dependent peptidase
MNFEIKIRNLFTMKMLASVVLLAGASVAAFAQTPPPSAAGDTGGKSSKGAVMKGKTPFSREVLKVKLPKPQEATLSNGLQIALIENGKIPMFSMQMVFKNGGGLSDPGDKRGLAFLTASLLREGTSKRTSQQISEQIESLGATLTNVAGMTGFTANISTAGLIENFDSTLDVFADIIRNPQFPAAEVEKFKTRNLSQMQFQRSAPQFASLEQFYKAVYGAHPAGALLASPETLKAVASDEIKRFHGTFYRPNNAHLIVIGSVSMKELLPKLERTFGDWQKADVPALNIAPVRAPEKSGVFLINRPGSVQTVLRLGSLGINRNDPDFFALQVMNQIFGGGTTGRLFLNLREAKGYTYGAYSNLFTSKYPGLIWAEAEVRTEVTADALGEFMAEFGRIRDEKVSSAELENAKRSLTGSFALSLESPQALVSNVNMQKLYDLPADYWDKYPQRINAITVEDVQRVARKYYDPARLQIVAVGDAAKIKDALAKYGTVEAFDADGKPAAH